MTSTSAPRCDPSRIEHIAFHDYTGDVARVVARAQVRKIPSWRRSWANFSLLKLYSHMHECMGQLASFGPT